MQVSSSNYSKVGIVIYKQEYLQIYIYGFGIYIYIPIPCKGLMLLLEVCITEDIRVNS